MREITIEELRACFRGTAEAAKPRVKKCEMCGQTFVVKTRNGKQKYCSLSCKASARREKQRASRQERTDEFKRPKSQRTVSTRLSTFDAVAKAARAAGMSYGKYKAMLALKGA